MGGTITVFGSAYGDADVQSYLSAGTGITLSGSGEIASSITQYADSDVQTYLSGGTGVTMSGSGAFSVDATAITGQTALSGSVDTGNDLVLLYDNSATALKKVDVSTLLASAGAGNMNSFTLTGDSGSNQTVADGNTVDIAGGDGISTVAGATDTVTINVDSTVITGQTAETSIANDDLVLIYDTSASALRKMTKSNFVSGITGGAANAFSTFAVSGQSNVVADSDTDTLTFVAGTGMTIATDASSDTITFTSSGGGGGGSLPFTEFDGTNTASDPIVLSSANTAGELPLTLADTEPSEDALQDASDAVAVTVSEATQLPSSAVAEEL